MDSGDWARVAGGVVGCIVVVVLSLALSVAVVAALTLLVHLVFPQFAFWKEFLVLYVAAALLSGSGSVVSRGKK